MRNTGRRLGFLTQNWSLGELFRGTVKKYTADLILPIKFKRIIGMKEKFAQNMEVPVSLMKILLQVQGTFSDDCFLGE